MKRPGCLQRLCFSLLAALLLPGCGAEKVNESISQPSPLLPGFQSYHSRAEVLPALSKTLNAEVLEDSSLPDADPRPLFSIYTISYQGFAYCGQTGELHLQFFNDRLLQTWFFPQDAASCLAVLASLGQQIPNGDGLATGNTILRSGVDYRGTHYIAWEDRRLALERRRWIARYS